MYRVIRSDIYRTKDGSLDIDYIDQNHGGITTRPGKGKPKKEYDVFSNIPYETNDALLNGHTVYSVYAFSGDDYVSIFKDIKKGNWDVDSYSEWIDFTARYIVQSIINKNKPDILVIPESSSNLVLDLAKSVSKHSRLPYLPHAFIKNPVDKITLNISEGDPGYESANKVLNKIKQNGYFEAKLVPKRMLKFFRDVYTNDDSYADKLEGKKVAVLDDSMTSKSTMMNIFDVCDYLYDTADAYGVTIFKKTSSRKEVNSSTEELDRDDLLERVQKFASGRVHKFKKFEDGYLYLEHHSLQSLINNYIKYFNQNVREYGDGFAADWDPDDTMDILYKNGKIRTINPQWDDGTKLISTDGIDSIIVNGGWGTAFAGPSIKVEDYTVYDDIPDIRIDFA